MARSKVRRRDNLRYIEELKRKGKCKLCGSTKNLVFHHVDEESKRGCIAHFVSKGYTLNTIRSEIDKCVILCSSCHSKLHAQIRRYIKMARGAAA